MHQSFLYGNEIIEYFFNAERKQLFKLRKEIEISIDIMLFS